MALTHLADTSVLKRLGEPTVRTIVAGWAKAGVLARASIGDLEIGCSARNEAEWDRLLASLEVLSVIETTDRHVARALQVQRMLAARSQRGRRIPDLLIAAAAEGAGVTLVHYDHDYEAIGRVTGQPTRWLAPKGSLR